MFFFKHMHQKWTLLFQLLRFKSFRCVDHRTLGGGGYGLANTAVENVATHYSSTDVNELDSEMRID